MTAAAFAFWQLAQRRAQSYIPEMAAAFLRALRTVVDGMSEWQLERLVSSQNINAIFTDVANDALFARAVVPVQDQIRASVGDSFRYFTRNLPGAGKINGTLAVSFDLLNPRIVDAIRMMETRVIQSLSDDIRGTVRAAVEQGLRDGVGPRTIAREIRSTIGLGPSQLQQVENFRAALEGRDGRSVTNYTLRDKRFKAPQTPEQVDRQVAAYLKRRIAQNAEMNARTASLDAMRLGQRLSWEDAADKGIVDRARLMKQRIGVGDDRERPEHVAINDEVRHFDELYSNGEMVCGDKSWGCRCNDRYFQARQ